MLHFFCTLTTLVLVLPFLLWNPEPFITATLLYYLTLHQAGDNTSLWFFLPAVWQTPFLVLGGVLTLATVALASWRRSLGLVWPLAVAFCAYAVFIAFNKMSHLNYLWGVYALGCAALGLSLAGQSEDECHQQSRSASICRS